MTDLSGQASTDAGWLPLAKRVWKGAALLLVAVIVGAFMFQEGIEGLWLGWQAPEYSHGPLIPLISGYLFLRQMKQQPPHLGPVDDRWPGVILLLFALMIGLFGSIVQIQKIVALGIIFWVGGMILVSYGWTRGKQFWPPVVHLLFMMPLPYFLYWKTSLTLQHFSSEIGVEFIRMMNIPVYLEGNIIDLGAYKLHVAEACSGLRYLYPVMSFTYIFAVLYRGPVWHKAILLLAAAPLTILMNSFRVGVIGVMVDSYGIEHAEGFMHLFEGWVIFIMTIMLMIGLSRLLMMLNRDGRSFAEVLDLDLDGLGTQLARIGDIRPSRALIGVTLATTVVAFVWSPLTRPEPIEIERDPFLLFPAKLGDWEVQRRNRLDEDVERALRADDYLSVSLTDRRGPPVDLFVAWYRDQGRAEIHSPEVCIPAGGWEMSDIEIFDWTFELDGKEITFPINRAIIQKGLSKQLVYYWFDQSGRRVASDYAAKAYLLIDAIRTGRTDGALVRYITPMGQDESLESAEARLRSSIIDSLPVMPNFIATEL